MSNGRSKKPSRSSARRTIPDTLVSVKQEDAISLAEQEDYAIDLTMDAYSPPSTSAQDNSNEGGPEEPSQVDDSSHIDLTVDEVVDLTTQTIIDITDDDPSETRKHKLAGEPVPPPDNKVLAQKDDHDSLFDDPKPEPTRRVRFADNEMEHDAPVVNSEAQSPEPRAPPPAQPSAKTTSGRQKTKRGRKRALDCGTEGETVEPPRKMVAFSRGGHTHSLLTAVRGKVVEVNSEGKYRPFDARASAGSALAARTARALNQKGAGDQQDLMPMQIYINQPSIITNPDELEDYDEEEPAEVPPRSVSTSKTENLFTIPSRTPIPDPELDAMRDKWNQVKTPKTYEKSESQSPASLIRSQSYRSDCSSFSTGSVTCRSIAVRTTTVPPPHLKYKNAPSHGSQLLQTPYPVLYCHASGESEANRGSVPSGARS